VFDFIKGTSKPAFEKPLFAWGRAGGLPDMPVLIFLADIPRPNQ
jgi:hypothetical protein